MTNLRELAESCLETTLEDSGIFGLPVTITYPNGAKQSLTGQVTYNSRDAEGFIVNKPAITLRLSSLDYTLDPSKPLHVRIPATPSLTGTMEDYICDRPVSHGKSLGVVTLYLTRADQSTVVEEEEPGD